MRWSHLPDEGDLGSAGTFRVIRRRGLPSTPAEYAQELRDGGADEDLIKDLLALDERDKKRFEEEALRGLADLG